MRSIRIKFIAFIAALLLVLLLLLNTYPVSSSRDTVFEEKRSSMGGQASLLATSLAGLDRLSRDGVTSVLSFLDFGGYDRILVTDADGAVVYDMADSDEASRPRDVFTALDGKTVFRSAFTRSAFSSSMTVPMSSRGSITGAVYLHESDTERARIIVNMQNRIRVISVTLGTAALIIVVVYTAAMMRRLQELVQSMHLVAAGDYSYRHEVKGTDEIGQLGQEFNLLTQRLEATEKQRRRFVSDASHELKTPLASIRLLSDSIVQNGDMDGDTVREFVSDIGNEARRLQNTTEKLLRLSLADDGIRYVPVPVDVKKTALEALVPLQPLARAKDVSLRTELEEGCVVMASVDELFPIIFNLTENAIKYNVPGGSVTLSVRGEDERVVLTVADTGIGIPEEDLPYIFDRFYRVDKARSREAGGSGLGLSIVHDAVLTLNGSIEVGQNMPQGTVFTVRFPRPGSEETGK